jgi:hypothetical protein
VVCNPRGLAGAVGEVPTELVRPAAKQGLGPFHSFICVPLT